LTLLGKLLCDKIRNALVSFLKLLSKFLKVWSFLLILYQFFTEQKCVVSHQQLTRKMRKWQKINWYLSTLSESNLWPCELFAVHLNFDTFNNGTGREALFNVSKCEDFLHTIYTFSWFLIFPKPGNQIPTSLFSKQPDQFWISHMEFHQYLNQFQLRAQSK